jgi:hypothetical protein
MTEQYLNYNGTSGWSGSETSQERAVTMDKSGKTAYYQQYILGVLRIVKHFGVTWGEVAEGALTHHGTASSALTNLHKAGVIVRLKQKRGKSAVYVLPEFAASRETAPYKPNKTKQVDYHLMAELVAEHLVQYGLFATADIAQNYIATRLKAELEAANDNTTKA